MKLYHITRKENIDSIIEKGIIPNYRKGLGSRGSDKVFLTNDVNKIIKTQGGIEWETNIAIIEVDVKNYKPHLYNCYVIPKESDYEFVCEIVEPSMIKNIIVR